jgi:hypothetical protein
MRLQTLLNRHSSVFIAALLANFLLISVATASTSESAWTVASSRESLESRIVSRDIAWRITEIYIATMGYAPDNEGLRYWIRQIDTNPVWTPTTVAQSFFDQPLVKQKYPDSIGYAGLIDSLYQNIFGRSADEAGKSYWLGKLESGEIARNAMIIALIEGGWDNAAAASDMARFGNRVEVGLAFAERQAQRGLIYSLLSSTDQDTLRQASIDLLADVTAETSTRDSAIAKIDSKLDGLQAAVAHIPETDPIALYPGLGIWRQLNDREASIDSGDDRLVLHGANWSNGRPSETGMLDGNGVETIQRFNHIGATSYLKFQVHGAGSYMAVRVRPVGLPVNYWSTNHSWAETTVIPDDTWLYVRLRINEDGSWNSTLARDAYDTQGGQVLARYQGTLSSSQLESMREAPLAIEFLDNYGGTDTQVLVAEGSIEDRLPIFTPLNGVETFSYPMLGQTRLARTVAEMRPLAALACTSRTETLDLEYAFPNFSGPVDVYLGLRAQTFDGDFVRWLTPEGGVEDTPLESLNERLTNGELLPFIRALDRPVSGRITGLTEQLLGTQASSILPDGSYHFLLALTRAGAPESAYIWNAYLTVPGYCVERTVEDGYVGYLKGEVMAPSATLIHQGEEHEERLSVSGNSLIAIRKDGQIYFFHPALGNAPLTDETSQRALGYFMAGVLGDSNIDDRAPSFARNASSATKMLPAGGTIRLDTGIDIAYRDSNTIKATNRYLRWTVLKESNIDGSRGPHEKLYFLAPAGSPIPTNVFDVIFSRLDLQASYYGLLDGPTSRTVPQPATDTRMETYGSFIRFMPLLPTALLGDSWRFSDINDVSLFADLNVLDGIELAMEGIKQFASGTWPEACTDALVVDVGLDSLKTLAVLLTTASDNHTSIGPGDPAYEAVKNWLFNIWQGMGKCVASKSYEPFSEVVVHFADMLSLFKWALVDTAGNALYLTLTTKVYDEFISEGSTITDCTLTGQPRLGVSGNLILNAKTTGAIRVTADLSALGGLFEQPLSPTSDRGRWQSTVTVQPRDSGLQTIRITAYDSARNSTHCDLTVDIENPMSFDSCSITPQTPPITINKNNELKLDAVLSYTDPGLSADVVTANLSPIGGPALVYLSENKGYWSKDSFAIPSKSGVVDVQFEASLGSAKSTCQTTVVIVDEAGSDDQEYSISMHGGRVTLRLLFDAQEGPVLGLLRDTYYNWFRIDPLSRSRIVSYTIDGVTKGNILVASSKQFDWSSRRAVSENPFNMEIGTYYRLTVTIEDPSRLSGLATEEVYFALQHQP